MMQTVFKKGKRKLELRVNRLRNDSFREKVCFLHLPKCGGSSVHDALHNIASSSIYLDPIASKKAADLSGTALMASREHLLLYFMALPNIQYIGGHFGWSSQAYLSHRDSWNFITVVRHPVDRWFSQYFYNRYKESSHYKVDVDIETYLESKEGQHLGSSMVSKLSDESTKPEDALGQAIDNIDKFALVGVLEHLDRFYQDFHKKFGVKLYAQHERKNPASELQRAARSDADLSRRVEELCQPDLALYNYVLREKLKIT